MNNFDKNWRNAKNSIFRMEGRPEYKIPGEEGLIAKWKKGELDISGNANWQKWIASLKKAAAKGIAVKRVRVAPKTINSYIRFEIDLWQKYSTKCGEQFFFIDAADYKAIANGCGFDPKDFWLFDDTSLLMMNYTPAGQFSGDIQITDTGMISRYRELKEKLLKASQPMNDFVKKYLNLWRRGPLK